ncbi:Ribosome bioproteinsis ATPase rix7 [Rhodotorula kratochvilovae]
MSANQVRTPSDPTMHELTRGRGGQAMLHLNRQLSGMTTRRNNSLSLNQPSPLSAQPATPTDSAQAAGQGDAAVAASSSSLDTAPSPSTSGQPALAKRKLRPSTSSRDPSTPKRSRPAGSSSSAAAHVPPTTRLADLGGVDQCIEQMLELVALPLMHPEVYLHTGVRPPRGVLLVGPPGCGKTMLAGAIAGELGLPFISISAPSVVSGMSGESEKTLRETFEEAARQAPCILFIDEIDAITPKRETAQREMERRIVAQLLTCMDDLAWDKTDNKPVMVISATNRPDSLDPALRRAGRFDAEITMGVPDEAGRERILRVLMGKLRLAGDFDYAMLAKGTPGYVGADLSALTGAAGVIAVKRIFEQFGPDGVAVLLPELATGEGALSLLQKEPAAAADGDAEMAVDGAEADSSAIADDAAPSATPTPGAVTPNEEVPPAVDGVLAAAVPALPFSTLPPSLASLPIATFLRAHPTSLTADQLSSIALTNADFVRALSIVQPSSQREGFTTVPDVSWDDLGALDAVRDEMRMSIVRPIRRPDVFRLLGLNAPCGVLLWGPPGCGKTLLAKAVANESRANFISVKGPELLNKYVGESERAVRQVFARARASSPCIIFFDELDAMVPRRDDSLSESSARIVNTLLTELDGLEPRKQVFVIGATNRPDILDPAMCRPGRLDKLLYVDLPSPAERVEILRACARKTPLAQDVDLAAVAAHPKADGLSGADLAALVREAATSAVKELFASLDLDLDGPALGADSAPVGQDGLQARVEMRHFAAALERANPSVSRQQRRRFEVLRKRFAGQPVGHRGEAGEEGEAAAVVPVKEEGEAPVVAEP